MNSTEQHERAYWRRIGFVLFFALAIALLLIPLGGCATTEEEIWQRVCYEQLMGKSEEGLLVVRHFCIKEEKVP